jgi:hypothetical protein
MTTRHHLVNHTRACAVALALVTSCASPTDLDGAEPIEADVQHGEAALTVAAPTSAPPSPNTTGPRVVDKALAGAADGATAQGGVLVPDAVADGLVPPSCGPDEPIGCFQTVKWTECCAKNEAGACVSVQTCRRLDQLCKNVDSNGTPNYYTASGQQHCEPCRDTVETDVSVGTWY